MTSQLHPNYFLLFPKTTLRNRRKFLRHKHWRIGDSNP